MTTITVVCAVCHKELGTKDGQGQTGISHSYCPDCMAQALREIEDEEMNDAAGAERQVSKSGSLAQEP